ncbi:MAG: zinc ABC transporter substrate-binding protein [Scytonema hyalinum WJT4-NPBG1]|jgi:manganese/iron transport system substrate-binding protein|nr:zinc ABC transporter substrate-binding protein [Scytonema hyalinum WJT4-NPBG1]
MYIPQRQSWKSAVAALTMGLLASCSSSPSTSQTNQTSPTAPDASSTQASSTATTDKGLKVVATNTVLCDMAQQVAANTIDLTCLIKPGADPHVYQPTPEDRKAIEDGKLILYGGYNFEPGLIKLIKSTSNKAPKVGVDEIAVPTPQKFEEDGKTVIDPHVWHNAQNGIAMVKTIQESLAKVAPENASLYQKNAQTITTQLGQIDTWIKSEIATIPQQSRKLVTTHDALGYYSKAYNIPVEGALEGISTEEKPTAARVKGLVKKIKDSKVPTIFAELSINPKLISTVAKEANVKVAQQELFADGLGDSGSEGDTYQKTLISNTKTIVEGLGGKYTPFQAK